VEDGQGLHKGFKRGSAGEEDHHHHHQLPELPLGLQSASPQTMMPVSSTMSKESTSYDMAEFDQSAIFLYLDGHDQEQRRMLPKKSSLLSRL